MKARLIAQAIIKFSLGALLIGLMIFLPAGSIAFYNAWLLMAILFVPMFIAGVIMMVKSPSLLEKRLNAKEKEKDQDYVVKLSGIMFLAGFIVAGLNFRYKWHTIPTSVVIMIVICRNAVAFRKSRFYRLLAKLFFLNTILHYTH